MLAFQVSIIGQLLVYGVLALLAMSTIWLSNLLTSVLQARLGDSSRGNDIAKALSMVHVVRRSDNMECSGVQRRGSHRF